MASELYKALEGHEMVVAAVLAFLVTLYMILTGKKATQHVNPGREGEGSFVHLTEKEHSKESHACLSRLFLPLQPSRRIIPRSWMPIR